MSKATKGKKAQAEEAPKVSEALINFVQKLMEALEENGEGPETGHGKIYLILKCYIRGKFSKAEIAAYGREYGAWSPVTVYRQISTYDELKKMPATHYQGFDVFESRVQRLMKGKGMSREKAVDYIMSKDLDDKD